MQQPMCRPLGPYPIAAAAAGVVTPVMESFAGLLALTASVQVAVGTGGTSINVYLQTSLDQGQTWRDVAAFNFTTGAVSKDRNFSKLTPQTADKTPGDGVLASGTSVDGILGDRFRWKYTSVGTYTGNTTLSMQLNPS